MRQQTLRGAHDLRTTAHNHRPHACTDRAHYGRTTPVRTPYTRRAWDQINDQGAEFPVPIGNTGLTTPVLVVGVGICTRWVQTFFFSSQTSSRGECLRTTRTSPDVWHEDRIPPHKQLGNWDTTWECSMRRSRCRYIHLFTVVERDQLPPPHTPDLSFYHIFLYLAGESCTRAFLAIRGVSEHLGIGVDELPDDEEAIGCKEYIA